MYYIDMEFINKPFPCQLNDYVHTTMWQGCYRVVGISDLGFRIIKNRKERLLAWKYFYCLYNDSPIKKMERIKEFEKYLKQNL